ncbi:ABC transporter substrate-binding protein [Nocardia camponoti]|uniref:ABC transporter substrate-binding protein n=1 Tax=Nocardia camponoti TaxID=1616106 RepID=A0A917V4P1_9NOCA|nr:ABC transporter substrate-binding protein [Nocardia camponoti]GGK36238.1 ABC transporter substrate-binding protein [Nocardia camponoti]
MIAVSPTVSRRRFLWGSAALASGLAVGGALTACAPGGDTATVGGDTPVRGGRLRMGVLDGNQKGNLDPHIAIGFGSIVRGFALYAKPWEWGPTMQPQLALAEFAEPNADASVWTIRLRQGLEFHHGKTVTADDLIHTIRRIQDPKTGSAVRDPFVDADALRKVDDRTVEVRFVGGRGYLPFPAVFVNFGGVIPTDFDPVTNPVGAGPYKLVDYTPGQRSLFTRFNNYFRPGTPYPDELEIIDFKDDAGRVAALQAGQIDTADRISSEQLRVLEGDKRVSIVANQTGNAASINLNLAKEPFNNPKVVEAVRLILDRDELVARALGGRGRVANDVFSPNDPTFPTGIAQRKQDITRAKALLAEAGAQNLSFELTVGPVANASATAAIVAEQARKAGVKVTINQVDSATFNGPQRDQWVASIPTSAPENPFASRARYYTPNAPVNPTHFDNPRFTELYEQVVRQPDTEKRKPLVAEMEQIFHDKGGEIIWGYIDSVDAVASRVGGVVEEKSMFPTWRFDKLWLRQ